MPRSCCVVGCHSSANEENKRSLLKFPENPDEHKKWHDTVLPHIRQGKGNQQIMYICEVHFTQSSFYDEQPKILKDGVEVTMSRQKKRLKPGSTPSIFYSNQHKECGVNNFADESRTPPAGAKLFTKAKKVLSEKQKVNSIVVSETENVKEESFMENVKEESFVENVKKESFVENVKEESFVENVKEESFVENVKEESFVENIKEESFVENIKEESFMENVEEESFVENVKEESFVENVKEESFLKNVKEELFVEPLPENYSITDLVEVWKTKFPGNVPQNWGMITTSQGAFFTYVGDINQSLKIARSLLVRNDMSVEIQVRGKKANFPILDKVVSFQDLVTAMTKITCLKVCAGANCSAGFYIPLAKSCSDKCKPCQKESRRQKDREKKQEQRRQLKLWNENKPKKKIAAETSSIPQQNISIRKKY